MEGAIQQHRLRFDASSGTRTSEFVARFPDYPKDADAAHLRLPYNRLSRLCLRKRTAIFGRKLAEKSVKVDRVDGNAGEDRRKQDQTGESTMYRSALFTAFTAAAALGASTIAASAAWEPVRPVEFIVPAGTGGGADQMARTIQ